MGDVKQSIYRWRNGDWNLLASQVENDLSHFGASTIPLQTNWRSSKNVIEFNNSLFRESSRLLNEDFESSLNLTGLASLKGMIEKVYADHYQKYSEKASNEGYIKVQFLDTDTNRRGEFREAAIDELITQIETVQDKGVHAGDIAILVRGKSDGALIAKALLDKKSAQTDDHYCYNVISNDSLIIGQSPAVRFILNFFNLFANPDNDIVKADLIYSYNNYLAKPFRGLKPRKGWSSLLICIPSLQFTMMFPIFLNHGLA